MNRIQDEKYIIISVQIVLKALYCHKQHVVMATISNECMRFVFERHYHDNETTTHTVTFTNERFHESDIDIEYLAVFGRFKLRPASYKPAHRRLLGIFFWIGNQQ